MVLILILSLLFLVVNVYVNVVDEIIGSYMITKTDPNKLTLRPFLGKNEWLIN